jgi:hypothetical protein
MHWDKRGTGSNCNSDSGCHLITGNMTKRVLAACPLSRRCHKREIKKDHPKELCPQNYDGSSKGMEAFGAAFKVNGLYQNFKCYTKKFVSDDDASTKSILRWSYRQAQELYKAVWPRTGANNKKKDNGLLHILHKPIVFLADANHRVKTYAGPIFALGCLPKGSSKATSTNSQ